LSVDAKGDKTGAPIAIVMSQVHVQTIIIALLNVKSIQQNIS
jgi:hypothetical protein